MKYMKLEEAKAKFEEIANEVIEQGDNDSCIKFLDKIPDGSYEIPYYSHPDYIIEAFDGWTIVKICCARQLRSVVGDVIQHIGGKNLGVFKVLRGKIIVYPATSLNETPQHVHETVEIFKRLRHPEISIEPLDKGWDILEPPFNMLDSGIDFPLSYNGRRFFVE